MADNTNLDIWVAGAFAAFSVDLLVYPLDTLKTRIQSPDYTTYYKNADGSFNRSLFRGLYQGIGSILLITLPSSGAFFTTYEALKYSINESMPANSTLYIPQAAIHSVSSGGAELVSCAILTPAEVLKQNAQVIRKEKGVRGSTTLLVLKEFKKHPTRLWAGYTALAARNLPYTGMQFPIFEHLKAKFLERSKKKHGDDYKQTILQRGLITAMSAGISGSVSAWITTPIDVVKTRMMLAAGKEHGKPDFEKDPGKWLTHGLARNARKGGFTVAAEVFKAEGTKGLFRGAALRAVWTAVGSGLYLGVYEGGRFYLEDRRKSEGDSLMQKDWKDVKVGVGRSRSQDVVKKSAWQDD